MACLGGRSPFEVVTGLKPRMPGSLFAGVPVETRGTDEYVKDLMEHLKEVHSSVQRVALQTIATNEETLGGRISAELRVGDTVLVRRGSYGDRGSERSKREGPTRFQPRVLDGIFVIKKK